MFTGIIETLGQLKDMREEGANCRYCLEASFADPIHIDQSIAHDGVCLTVDHILWQHADRVCYEVVAIAETLAKTRLRNWQKGDAINLERSLRMGDRLDGHLVQGHVDGMGQLKNIEEQNGAHLLSIAFDPAFAPLLVDKGAISVNGVSLTVVQAGQQHFSVAIIPYTWQHSNLSQLKPEDRVNLEFDLFGKYLLRWRELGL